MSVPVGSPLVVGANQTGESATVHGFHPHASGLLVPEAHARKRIICTYEDWKKLDRALNVLNGLAMRMQFRCDKDGCSPIVKVRDAGGVTLRCDCSDRVFTKSF